jgi:hypothetical protein
VCGREPRCGQEVFMSDLLFIVVTVAFFAACHLVLRGLERL